MDVIVKILMNSDVGVEEKFPLNENVLAETQRLKAMAQRRKLNSNILLHQFTQLCRTTKTTSVRHDVQGSKRAENLRPHDR